MSLVSSGTKLKCWKTVALKAHYFSTCDTNTAGTDAVSVNLFSRADTIDVTLCDPPASLADHELAPVAIALLDPPDHARLGEVGDPARAGITVTELR